MLGVNEETRDERKKGSAPFIVIIPSRRTSKERKEKLVKTERERNGASAATTAGRAKAAMCWPFGVVYGTPRLSWNNYYILAVPKKTLFSKVLSRYEDKFARRTRKKESCAPMHQDTQQTVDINSAFSFLYTAAAVVVQQSPTVSKGEIRRATKVKVRVKCASVVLYTRTGQGKKKQKKRKRVGCWGQTDGTDHFLFIYILPAAYTPISLSLSLSLSTILKRWTEKTEKNRERQYLRRLGNDSMFGS